MKLSNVNGPKKPAYQKSIVRVQALTRDLKEVIELAPEEIRLAAESEIRALSASIQPVPVEAFQGRERLDGLLYQPFMENNSLLFDILENVYDGFFALDREWRYIYINRRAAQTLGYRPEELTGKNLWQVFPRLRGTVAEEHYRKAMDEGQPSQYRIQGVYSQRWYDISVYPSRQGISVFSVDRTEQVEAITELSNREIMLRESEERLRLALEGANQGIWDWDLKKALMVWDGRCKEIYGLPPYLPATYDLLLERLHPEDCERVRESLQASIQNHAPYVQEYRILWPDSSLHWVQARGRVFYDASGSPERMSGTVMDITAQKEAEILLQAVERERRETTARVELQQRLLEQREKDRQNIARDLHDGPVQTLSSAIFNIQYTKEIFPDPALRVDLDQIGFSIKSAVRELRQVIHELRPPSILRFGLASSIAFHAMEFRERHPHIKLDIDMAEDQDRLSEQTCLTLFRIYQETMSKLARRKSTNEITVHSYVDVTQVVLEICDQSRIFPLPEEGSEEENQNFNGLESIAAWVEAIRGTFAFFSESGKGMTIKITAPLEA